MSPLGNGAAGYQVVYPDVLLQKLKRFGAGLADAGAVHRFTAAVRTIHSRLRKDPLVFGEPRNHLVNLRLTIRDAMVGPVFVSYGVHDDLPLVFVRSFSLFGAPEP